MNLHVPQWERFGPDTNSKTDNNQTDGETDGQGDSYVVYTPKLCQGGYNDNILLHNWVIMKRCLLINNRNHYASNQEISWRERLG